MFHHHQYLRGVVIDERWDGARANAGEPHEMILREC